VKIRTDRPLDAVLWDLDGTLVDTEPSWIAAEYRLVESYGGSWSDAHAKAQVGNPLVVTGEYLREHGGVPLPAERIVELLLADVLADVRREVHWRPGVRRLLAECREQGLATALVTMSYLELAEAVTARLPAGSFDVLVTGDQVRRGKPDPEAYLLAADRLGVDPARCLAIEDSPTGVASAEAAGCLVVAVPNQVPIPPADSRTILPDLARLRLAELIALALPSPASTR
jgi:HAD superfamily hydrolase (TIGR01509 family)